MHATIRGQVALQTKQHSTSQAAPTKYVILMQQQWKAGQREGRWLGCCQGDAAWVELKVTTASGCLHIKSRKRVELFAGRQSKGDGEGGNKAARGKGDRQHAEKTDFLFATVALLHATWKFCVNNNATCRLKTAEHQNARETRDGAEGGGNWSCTLKKLLNNNGVCMLEGVGCGMA